MYYLNVSKKTGFIGNNPEIYDKRGLFYNKAGDVYFNLPPGNYTSVRPVILLKYPIRYKVPSLPFSERFTKLPKSIKDFKIEFSDHGNKAMIDVANNRIIFSNEFKNYTTPQMACVAFHELGHYFYSTEKYCDAFALKCMIIVGFNPSQAREFLHVLSDNAMDRKKEIYEFAKKVEKEKRP